MRELKERIIPAIYPSFS